MKEKNIVQPYQRFAEVYDEIGHDEFSITMLKRLNHVLRTYRFDPQSALDVACGTGTLALALARQGIRVTGLDKSSAMLAKAREKAAQETHLPVTFLEGDMRCFTLPQPVQLVTCFFDAMNYNLSEADLSATFRCVYQCLAPGGLFIFDMNSVHALGHIWGNNVFAEDRGTVAYIWENEYEPITRTGTLTAIFFVQKGEQYERFVEVHIERAYFITEVQTHLKAAGFQVLDVLRPNGRPADETASRHLYVVRKDT